MTRFRTGLLKRGNELRGFIGAPDGAFGLAVFLLYALAAILAPILAPQNPFDLSQIDMLDGRLPPGSLAFDGFRYVLGTDDQGRDVLSAILYGIRLSLFIGVGSAVLASIIGVTVGIVAAYRRNWVGDLLMRIVDFQLAFPSVLVALMIIAFLGKGYTNVLVALVAVEWAYYARAARASALAELSLDYTRACHCLALPWYRILFRHILPNCLPSLTVIATTQVARAIALEATLSFLGLGVSVTEPSLGLQIANGRQYLLSGETWISIFPGIALLLMLASINLLGDRLRDVLNPRLR